MILQENPQTRWLSPGKLNLFLHITGQRSDGYHELQTVFQFIDIADEICLSVNDSGQITGGHEHPDIHAGQDLTLRAARLLQSVTGCPKGVRIQLDKKLPIGGGVGGGSSNAATVLVALNQLWETGLSREELVKLGLQLGADVPVFIRGQTCWAEGIGEDIKPVELPESDYLVIYPGVPVSTGEVFSAADLTRDAAPITITDFLAGAGHNDCEAVVRRLVPEVNRALEWLGRYASARMTGTGACVFAAFESQEAAMDVAQRCNECWQIHVCKGYNLSPLHRQLQALL